MVLLKTFVTERYTETGSIWGIKGPYSAPKPALKVETRREGLTVALWRSVLLWRVSRLPAVGGKRTIGQYLYKWTVPTGVVNIQNWRMFVK